jgi:acetyl-CoA acetyltransferase
VALSRDTAIVGIGQTEFSKHSGRSELQLAGEAVAAAVADAGLTPADIDGAVTFAMDVNDELAVMRCAGIPSLRFTARTRGGGGGACATVQLASAAVASGTADAVVVYRAFNERSGRRFGQPISENNKSRVVPPGWNWYLPFGLDTPAKVYSLWYQRYMHRYGVTNMDFALYPVVARKHAATNPNAFYYQQPLTLEQHQESRWIVEPILRKLDCCQESDGGVALVVTSADRAADLPHPAARIAAVAEADLGGGHVMFNYYHPDLARFDETEFLARQLYTESGLGPTDMQAAMIYENFSPVVFLQLEALGFCGPGEARDFIAEGNIELGGKLPVNTHGGLLGEAYIHGVNNILEAVRQIRGTAVNQVPDVEHVMVAGGRSGIILGQAS